MLILASILTKAMLILACHYLLTTRGYLYLPPVSYFKTRNSLLKKNFYWSSSMISEPVPLSPSVFRQAALHHFQIFRHVALHHFQIFRHVA